MNTPMTDRNAYVVRTDKGIDLRVVDADEYRSLELQLRKSREFGEKISRGILRVPGEFEEVREQARAAGESAEDGWKWAERLAGELRWFVNLCREGKARSPRTFARYREALEGYDAAKEKRK